MFSSRRLQKRLQEDIGFKLLAAGNEPDFRTLSDFRKLHLKVLQGLFEQVLRMALELGALKLGGVAIDGSKVKANASKHKAMSYQRMREEQQRLGAEVRRLLAEAERVDAEEDARYGRNSSGDELPAELQRREERLRRIGAAKRALEERVRQEAEAEVVEHAGSDEIKEEAEKKAVPKDTDQYNFTDADSRIMKGADGFVQPITRRSRWSRTCFGFCPDCCSTSWIMGRSCFLSLLACVRLWPTMSCNTGSTAICAL